MAKEPLYPHIPKTRNSKQASTQPAQTKELTVTDSDLWGLYNALTHGLQDGYFDDNKAWCEQMLERIRRIRE